MWRRVIRNKIAMVALAFIVFLVFVAIFAPLIAPYDPDEQDLVNTFAGSSSEHWLGTDDLGRDTLSRLIYATRLSMRAAIQTMILAVVIAVPLGLIAGYFRGWADSVISRTVDAMFTFPPIVLAISIVALLGANLTNLSIAIAIVFIPGLIRLVRGQVLAVREEVFIEASRSVGASPFRILRTHIFPNVASPVIVSVSAELRLHPPHRGRAHLPRPRRAAAGCELGRHAPARVSVGVRGAVAERVARAGHRAHRPRVQPPR